MADNPRFDRFIEIAQETHRTKNHDYAEDSNPYSNFEFAAQYAGVPVNTVFDVMIGIKQARLLVLRRGKSPQNESLQDSEKDLAIYAMLRASYGLDVPEQLELKIDDSILFQLGRQWCPSCKTMFTGSWPVVDGIGPYCPKCGRDEVVRTGGDERFDSLPTS